MHKLLLFVAVTLATLHFSVAARAQKSEFEGSIQLRLKNSLPEKIDYYFTPEGGSPKLAGSLEAGVAADVKSQPGIVWLFAQNRKPFQKYTTRAERFQQLTIAPAGRQTKPLVANAYQPALKTSNSASAKSNPAQTKPQATQPAIATNPNGMEWSTGSSEGGEGTMYTLTLAVPETDNSQVFAACSSMPVGLIHVLVGWDVSRMVPGQETQVRFVGNGFDRTFRGAALVDNSGERLSGAEFPVKAADPLWKQLKSVSSVRYNVGGKGSATLGLVGLNKPLDLFLMRCLALTSDDLDPVPENVSAAGGTSKFKSFAARSWGGIVRSGPGLDFARVASLKEGDPITAIAMSDRELDGFPWFKIRFGRNQTGYQWGGIICPVGKLVAGTFEQCQ